ncbi:hypothetical protein RI367_007252 [Sorochytrium milnesiophthora]
MPAPQMSTVITHDVVFMSFTVNALISVYACFFEPKSRYLWCAALYSLLGAVGTLANRYYDEDLLAAGKAGLTSGQFWTYLVATETLWSLADYSMVMTTYGKLCMIPTNSNALFATGGADRIRTGSRSTCRLRSNTAVSKQTTLSDLVFTGNSWMEPLDAETEEVTEAESMPWRCKRWLSTRCSRPWQSSNEITFWSATAIFIIVRLVILALRVGRRTLWDDAISAAHAGYYLTLVLIDAAMTYTLMLRVRQLESDTESQLPGSSMGRLFQTVVFGTCSRVLYVGVVHLVIAVSFFDRRGVLLPLQNFCQALRYNIAVVCVVDMLLCQSALTGTRALWREWHLNRQLQTKIAHLGVAKPLAPFCEEQV